MAAFGGFLEEGGMWAALALMALKIVIDWAFDAETSHGF